jgi:hypothetical protein
MPQPERPEPLITRVPLLGLKEYLDNYVFDSGIDPEDRYLHDQAGEIGKFAGEGNRRVIGVARVKFPDGRIEHVVATSFAYFTPDKRRQIESEYNGYIVLPNDRNNSNHAELLIVEWAEAQGITVEAIGVSHPVGICDDCWNSMNLRQIKRASRLASKDYRGNPPRRPLD